MMPQQPPAYPAFNSWFLIPFSDKKNQGSLEKGLVLGLGQEIYKMSLEHLAVLGSKEGIK